MGLTTLTGAISGVRHSTETVGQMGRNGGSVRTGQVLAFRVGERSAQIKLPNVPDVKDGDSVTLAGRVKNGVFEALALRNDATAAIYRTPPLPGYVLGGLLVAVGVPLLFIFVGVLFIAVGAYTLYQAYTYDRAAKLLQGQAGDLAASASA